MSSSSSGSFWTKDLGDLSIGRMAARFCTWYRDEFFAFFSPAALTWLLDRGERKLVLHSGYGPKELRLAGDGEGSEAAPITPDELLASSLAEALARRGLTRATTKIVVEIAQGAFFVRRFDVPLAAQPNLPRILIAEIEHKTPFKASDVHFGFVCVQSPENPEKLRVEQWILRRDLLTTALEGSGLGLDDLDVVEPEWPEQAAAAAPSIEIGRRAESSNLFRNTVIGLCALAAVLFAVGVVSTIWREDRVGTELDAKINVMSTRAARVRQISDRATAESGLLATLRQERKRFPALADLWEEISRLLPDDAYLLELRLSEGPSNVRVVDMNGFAKSAVGLPALFHRSPLLSDAALTAPITPDATEKREAFSLQAQVRQSKMAKSK